MLRPAPSLSAHSNVEPDNPPMVNIGGLFFKNGWQNNNRRIRWDVPVCFAAYDGDTEKVLEKRLDQRYH